MQTPNRNRTTDHSANIRDKVETESDDIDDDNEFFDEDDDWGEEEFAMLKDCESQYFSAFPLPEEAVQKAWQITNEIKHNNDIMSLETTPVRPGSYIKLTNEPVEQIDTNYSNPGTVSNTPPNKNITNIPKSPSIGYSKMNLIDNSRKEIETIQMELLEKKGEISVVRRNLVNADKQIQDLQNQIIQERKKSAADNERAYRDLHDEIDNLRTKLAFLHEESRIWHLQKHKNESNKIKKDNDNPTSQVQRKSRSSLLNSDISNAVRKAESLIDKAHYSDSIKVSNKTTLSRNSESFSNYSITSSQRSSNVNININTEKMAKEEQFPDDFSLKFSQDNISQIEGQKRLNNDIKNSINKKKKLVHTNNKSNFNDLSKRTIDFTKIDKINNPILGPFDNNLYNRKLYDSIRPDTPELDSLIFNERFKIINKLKFIDSLVSMPRDSYFDENNLNVLLESQYESLLSNIFELITADLKWKIQLLDNVEGKWQKCLRFTLDEMEKSKIKVHDNKYFLSSFPIAIKIFNDLVLENKDIFSLLSFLTHISKKVRLLILNNDKYLTCLQNISGFNRNWLELENKKIEKDKSQDNSTLATLNNKSNENIITPISKSNNNSFDIVNNGNMQNLKNVIFTKYPLDDDFNGKNAITALEKVGNNGNSTKDENIGAVDSLLSSINVPQPIMDYISDRLNNLSDSLAIGLFHSKDFTTNSLNEEFTKMSLASDYGVMKCIEDLKSSINPCSDYLRSCRGFLLKSDDHIFSELYNITYDLFDEKMSNMVDFKFSKDFVSIEQDIEPICRIFLGKSYSSAEKDSKCPSSLLNNLRYGTTHSLTLVSHYISLVSSLSIFSPSLLNCIFLGKYDNKKDDKTMDVLSPFLALMFSPIMNYKRIVNNIILRLQTSASYVMHSCSQNNFNLKHSTLSRTTGISKYQNSNEFVNPIVFNSNITEITKNILKKGTISDYGNVQADNFNKNNRNFTRGGHSENRRKSFLSSSTSDNNLKTHMKFETHGKYGQNVDRQILCPLASVLNLSVSNIFNCIIPTCEVINISLESNQYFIEYFSRFGCVCGSQETYKKAGISNLSDKKSENKARIVEKCVCWYNMLQHLKSGYESVEEGILLSDFTKWIMDEATYNSKSLNEDQTIDEDFTGTSKRLLSSLEYLCTSTNNYIETTTAKSILPQMWRHSIAKFIITTYTHASNCASSLVKKSEIGSMNKSFVSTDEMNIQNHPRHLKPRKTDTTAENKKDFNSAPLEERVFKDVLKVFGNVNLLRCIGILITIEGYDLIFQIKQMIHPNDHLNINRNMSIKKDEIKTINENLLDQLILYGETIEVLFKILATDGLVYGPETFGNEREEFIELDKSFSDMFSAIEEYERYERSISLNKTNGHSDSLKRCKLQIARFL